MKIKPEILLTSDTPIQNFKKILVTGFDETFIEYVEKNIIKNFKDNNFYINLSNDIDLEQSNDLFFSKKTLHLIKNYSLKTKKQIDFVDEQDVVLFSFPNNKSALELKKTLAKSKDALLVECYSLSRSSKELILKDYVKKNEMVLSGEVFWFIIENFKNEYVFFIGQLDLVFLYSKKIEKTEDIEKIVNIENSIGINRLFFQIFNNNKYLIKLFETNIYSQQDFYLFLNSLKNYLSIITESSNKEEVINRFPKYLFNERDLFIKIYESLNKNKIKILFKNIIKAEKLTRKHSSLYKVIGMRFLINTKKLIIS